MSESGILKGAGETAIERGIGHREAVVGGECGFGINRSGRRVTITHANTMKDVKKILFLGEMEAGVGAGDRDAEKMVERAEIFHGKLRTEAGDDGLKK
jgi:hypothetical protein